MTTTVTAWNGKVYRVTFREDGEATSVKVQSKLANGGESWRELIGRRGWVVREAIDLARSRS